MSGGHGCPLNGTSRGDMTSSEPGKRLITVLSAHPAEVSVVTTNFAEIYRDWLMAS